MQKRYELIIFLFFHWNPRRGRWNGRRPALHLLFIGTGPNILMCALTGAKDSVSGFRNGMEWPGARGGPRTICSEGFDWSEYVLSGLNFSLYMFRNYFFLKKTCLGSFREERNSHFVAVCYKVPLKH